MLNFLPNPLLNRYHPVLNTNINISLLRDVSLKTAVISLFSLTVIAFISFMLYCNAIYLENTHNLAYIKNFSLGSGVLSFIIAFFIYQIPTLSPILAPLYAIISAVFISGLSFVAEQKFPGIALLSIEITLLTFGVVYLGYKYGIIRVNSQFKTVVFTMVGVIVSLYLLSFILMFFDIKIPLIHNAGVGGALWTGFIMITASLHIAIDIDKVEKRNSTQGYTKWTLAAGLMVSLIWLYFSTLRFLLTLNKVK